MDKQYTFEQSLRTREFEDDAPNYTPRISGILRFGEEGFNYAMSILKSANGNPDSCQRYTFSYTNPIAGEGHFLYTDAFPLIAYQAANSTERRELLYFSSSSVAVSS